MVFKIFPPFLPNITLEHKPGGVNKAADALCRAPVLTSEGDSSTVEVLRVRTQEVEPLLPGSDVDNVKTRIWQN